MKVSDLYDYDQARHGRVPCNDHGRRRWASGHPSTVLLRSGEARRKREDADNEPQKLEHRLDHLTTRVALFHRVRISCRLIDGGGQERGLRSGTLPTPLCVGIGRAAAIAAAEMTDEAARLRGLRDRLRTGLARRVPALRVNGDTERRLPGNLNFGFPGIPAIKLIEACPGIAISTGSACTSASVEPSYVLRALGLSEADANSGIRVGLGRFTTSAEIDFAVDALAGAATRLAAEAGMAGQGAAPI